MFTRSPANQSLHQQQIQAIIYLNYPTVIMANLSKVVAKLIHPESSEQSPEEAKPEEPQQEEQSEEQPASEPPQTDEPSKPEAPKQEEPHPEQSSEPQIQKPMPPEGQPLPPSERVNAAYKLVYGENAEIPIKHESIVTEQDADWHIRSYMGGLFATPNSNPMTQQFNNLEELLEWFNKIYPPQESEKVTEAE